MTSERWRQIEQLYHAALERAPDEREAFLLQACAGDEELHHEAVSLLAWYDKAGVFIDKPPDSVVAKMVAEEQAKLMEGRRLGYYQIDSLLGAGGMGEVYLAEDTRLGRRVALKLLPREFTQDRERVQRFQREARAASALNHPNIITIFEVGQSEGSYYIVTEFIDGQTLRQWIKGSKLKLRESLEVAIQIASALVAAHEARIIHRDIKPENIMLRHDGYVKVLDFGLAKLTERLPSNDSTLIDNETGSDSWSHTSPGMVMGTVTYMSPEQARGLVIDNRTDIFSLGVVVYELVAGRPPFEGSSPNEVIAAILNQEPPLLARYLRETPAELERIVSKALQKDRDERYQTAKDLLIDLKNLKLDLELEAKLGRGRKPETHEQVTTKTIGGQAPYDAPERATARNDARATSPDASRAWNSTGANKHHNRGALLAATFAIVFIGLAFTWYQLRGQRKQAVPFQETKVKRFTTTGTATYAAISPDGKYVVYAMDEPEGQSLQFRSVATESNVPIMPPTEVTYRGVTFSHDGNFIYFVREEQNNSLGVLYRVPALGGAVRKLINNVDSPITLSPDGKRLAFVRRDAGEYALMIANEDGSDEKKLAVRKLPDAFRLNGPSWSPDGRIIACGNEDNTSSYRNVVGVNVVDGKEKPLSSQQWGVIGQVTWLPDGSGLIISASEQPGNLTQLWYLSYPGGEAHRITNDLNNYDNISLTADSGSLATVQSDRLFNIWTAPGRGARDARQITTGARREDGWRGLVWSHDGKIIYRSIAGGNPHIWIVEDSGTGNKQLSVEGQQNLDPTVSPDGHYIAWSTSPTGFRNIWRVDLDGGNPTQLTNVKGAWFPQYSPDGKWLIYQGLGHGAVDRSLWKMSLDGGVPTQLIDKPSYAPSISPDGKLIACNYRDEPGGRIKMAVIPFEGGSPIKIFDLSGLYDRPIRWTPDGRALAYIDTRGRVSNIWAQGLDGAPPKQLTDFKDQLIFNFAWSHDGKQLALSRGVINSDVVLISNAGLEKPK